MLKKPFKITLIILLVLIFISIVVSAALLLNMKAKNNQQQGLTPDQTQKEVPVQKSFQFAVSGDFAMNLNTASTISGMAASKPDFILALGDLSYGESVNEAAWCTFINERIPSKMPFELVIGNHDDGTPGNTNFADYASCLPSKINGLVGDYGTQNYFDYDGLARFINISPNIRQYGHEYYKNNVDYQWLVNVIDGARNAKIPWVIISMHKNCITIGEKSCEIGQDLQSLLVEKKVDLILQGHEHGYMRTKQLALSESCPQIIVDGFSEKCVNYDGSSSFRKGEGSIIAIVGTGGKDIRDVHLDDSEVGYFGAWDGKNIGNSYGFLDVRITKESLVGNFIKTSGGGSFTDSFTLQ